ncbi:hypothetical protein BD289DRAFT_437088 [Coniella lustricola]|uniref:Uncharacterized protein n=1 Tax=Coniella lustricola TaxID=2025994 RepID=A0A2T3A4H1_9PEZI|nr:hypothetical protein BD289DRAFT_437088 [Coniella lustricola]
MYLCVTQARPAWMLSSVIFLSLPSLFKRLAALSRVERRLLPNHIVCALQRTEQVAREMQERKRTKKDKKTKR